MKRYGWLGVFLLYFVQMSAMTDIGHCDVKTGFPDLSEMVIAARTGNVVRVRELLAAGHRVDEMDPLGNTPLHHAAYVGADYVVNELLRAGARVDVENGVGWTPLCYAAGGKFVSTKDLRDARGLVSGHISFFEAGDGYEGAVAKLLEHGTAGASKALRSSAQRGFVRIVDMILGCGEVDVDCCDELFERTALHLAASRGHASVARLLLTAGASRTARDHWGKTSSDCARYAGNTELAALLSQDMQDGVGGAGSDGVAGE